MIAHLTKRSLVTFRGEETTAFLNDLITADVTDLPEGIIRPAALLTPQGRVLFDMLVSRDGAGLTLELDTDYRELFIKKMTMYRMRRVVEITPDDRNIYAIDKVATTSSQGGLSDSRFDGDVWRYYGTRDDADSGDEAWQAFRYRHAIAEGAQDLPSEKALPLEAGLDLHDGISFSKGCYIGQEVTARTRYRGLLKRRYMSVRADSAITLSSDFPCDLEQNGKNAGQLLGLVADGEGWVGLASIRLNALETSAPITANGQELTVVNH